MPRDSIKNGSPLSSTTRNMPTSRKSKTSACAVAGQLAMAKLNTFIYIYNQLPNMAVQRHQSQSPEPCQLCGNLAPQRAKSSNQAATPIRKKPGSSVGSTWYHHCSCHPCSPLSPRLHRTHRLPRHLRSMQLDLHLRPRTWRCWMLNAPCTPRPERPASNHHQGCHFGLAARNPRSLGTLRNLQNTGGEKLLTRAITEASDSKTAGVQLRTCHRTCRTGRTPTGLRFQDFPASIFQHSSNMSSHLVSLWHSCAQSLAMSNRTHHANRVKSSSRPD